MIRVERLADGSVDAICDVFIGVHRRTIRVSLGRFRRDLDPGGLWNTPVVVLTEPDLGPVVRAGVARSGRASVTGVQQHDRVPIGAELLVGASAGEVLLVVTSDALAGSVLTVARALGGRLLPVVAFDDPTAAGAMLRKCDVDLDVAFPSVEEPTRGRLRDVADQIGLFTRHHVVEVDPRPALAEGNATVIAHRSLHDLAAAASGVLAGRVAMENRRWR